MANVFLNGETRDIETAIMLERAFIHDIGRAVAYTDGTRVFINTDENLEKILPAYNNGMLKWLLWHERFHMELRHHNRFFRYLEEMDDPTTEKEFNLSKEEVNIIMDILVHDSLSKLFPELVETARKNLAQMRDCNSLKYTFKSVTLEQMLDEYKEFKKGLPPEEKGEGEGESEDTEEKKEEKTEEESKSAKGKETDKKEHGESTSSSTPTKEKSTPEEGEPEVKDEPTTTPKHDEVDWSKLENIDSKEFIKEYQGDSLENEINRLKNMKLKLSNLTKTLNGLVTSTRQRTYAKPSYIHAGDGVMLKGSMPGRTTLYLIFDASGSMGCELATFKEIISKSIPQALETPTEWFSGYGNRDLPKSAHNPDRNNYYKAKFEVFMKNISASGGYDDDGDRTIELCWIAEQAGYTPIGVTDGGGQISWAKDKLKQLKRTVFVGTNDRWLERAKAINPSITILCI